MFDPKAYDLAREALLGDLLRCVGLLGMNLPMAPDAELIASRGYYRDSVPLKALADQIEAITYRFDRLCHALGHAGPSRFGHEPPIPDHQRRNPC